MDSGVATLYDASRVLLLRHLGGAEAGGPCRLFRSGVGSPFTADEFSLRGGGGGGGGSVTLVNVHIRMLYPNIAAPLAEVLRRAAALGVPSDWRRAVLAGDLNAGTAEAAADLAAALAAPPGAALRDVPTTAAAVRCDDHVLCGPALRVLSAARDGSLPLLDRLTRSDGVPTSDYKLWGTPGTPYAVHAGNAALIETAVTSDHPPLIVEIAVE
jgi:endonuclease/exonuclease/phosphatase family metal-dependent hydrolase